MALEAEEGDGGIAEGGEVLRCVATTDPAGILAERHVADVVRAVFDSPVITPPDKQLRRASQGTRHAGDGILNLRGPLATTAGRARQSADLLQSRPMEPAGQPRADLQAAMFPSAVPLVGCFRNVKLLLELPLVYRGKNPP